jgi:hypothetical protein
MSQRVANVPTLFQWFTTATGNSVQHECDRGILPREHEGEKNAFRCTDD